jgi:hypothetical protein
MNHIIEQQKERAKIIMSDTLSFIDVLDNGEIVELQNVVDTLTTQSITEAYRQALEDVLAGLYDVDVDKVPTIEQEAWANQYENKCEAFWYGESKGLSNVRAQIEGLLGKIE